MCTYEKIFRNLLLRRPETTWVPTVHRRPIRVSDFQQVTKLRLPVCERGLVDRGPEDVESGQEGRS